MTTDLTLPLPEGTEMHTNARKLVAASTAALVANDAGPLGSDRGVDAFLEFFELRADGAGPTLGKILNRTLRDWEVTYEPGLLEDETIRAQIAAETLGKIDLGESVYVLDETVIATGLAQLFIEGRIDADARDTIGFALRRQRHPLFVARFFGEAGSERVLALDEATRLVAAAPAKSHRKAREPDPRRACPWESGAVFRRRSASGDTLLLHHSKEALVPTFYILDWHEERLPSPDELAAIGLEANVRWSKFELFLPEKAAGQSVDDYWTAIHALIEPTPLRKPERRVVVECWSVPFDAFDRTLEERIVRE